MTLNDEAAPPHEIPRAISNLVDLLNWRAAEHPDDVAYIFLKDGETEDARVSYAELDRRARAISVLLKDSGLAGERALLLYGPGIEFIAAFFGCLYAGVLAVPTYPPRPAQFSSSQRKIQSLVKDACPAAALTTSSLLSMVDRLTAGLGGLRCIATDNVPADSAREWRGPELGNENLAFIQYTSGSISAPKGVMVSHGNLMHNQRLMHQAFGQSRNSVIVGWLPLYHDMGLIGNVIHSLYAGASCVLMSPMAFMQKPVRWLRAISDYGATTSGGPNFAYDLCVRKVTHQQRESLDLSGWEIAYTGAEPIRPDTVRSFSEVFSARGFRSQAWFPCYGLAEATLFVSGGSKASRPVIYYADAQALQGHAAVEKSAEDLKARAIVSCGRPSPGHNVLIIDPESLTRCQPGQVGEIWLSSPSVSPGYWRKTDETRESFDATPKGPGRDRFLRTGDLGFVADGEVFVTGRRKDLVIIRGRNHYPQDIEHTVEQAHPAFRQGSCIVFSIEREGQEQLVVVQEIEPRHKTFDYAEAMGAVRQAVAEQHDLHVFDVSLVSAGVIPKTSSGKPQRRLCRSDYISGRLQPLARDVRDGCAEAAAAPFVTRELLEGVASEEQAALIENWLLGRLANVLNLGSAELQPQQSLKALGLDSMMAIELANEIESSLGIVTPLAKFFEADGRRRLRQ
jgi:acyl-CoA synthetase (AMP-forming)/AMP-acid ligase II/acyl carrier protein